jgi:hypothetical protein
MEKLISQKKDSYQAYFSGAPAGSEEEQETAADEAEDEEESEDFE